ncbi:hypothetical protein FQN57_003460 [Myotisia sp. PD_48]|nr:hypothetical protein FQN57_003460 [Myotisia sp. PD_48]
MAPFHIAILDADSPVPIVRSRRGVYSDIFSKLLKEAAQRINEKLKPVNPAQFTFSQYNSVQGQYPRELSTIDGILITGSSYSSYDNEPWIRTLEQFILNTYLNHHQIKIFGSCFGHQIMCQSILGRYGALVERNPRGWELGVHTVLLNPEFLASLPVPLNQLPSYENSMQNQKQNPELVPSDSHNEDSSDLKTIKIQFVHADHVTLPRQILPSSWSNLGSSSACPVQGVLEKNRVLTFQGHFEFDRFINSETIKVFGAKWDPEFLTCGVKNTDKDDDANLLAEVVVSFFSGQNPEIG